MNVEIIPTTWFKREAKRLLKKYSSLKEELINMESQLRENPQSGIFLGKNTYKIRLAVKSKGKGKSGGLRMIYYLIEKQAINKCYKVYLLSIFDKSEYENISDNIIVERIEKTLKENEKR